MVTFSFGASYLMLWVLAGLEALLILVILRQLNDLRRIAELGGHAGVDRLPPGASAPALSVTDFRSGHEIKDSAFRGRQTVILFIAADCKTCIGLAQEMHSLPPGNLADTLMLCHGTDTGCQEFLESSNTGRAYFAKGTPALMERFRVAGFPTAVIIDQHWRVVGYRYPKDIDDIKDYFADNSLATPQLA